jgi:hypothetical protein
MNLNNEEFDQTIREHIERNEYLIAIHKLTVFIESLNCNNLLNNNNYKYYLIRSQCYRQISTQESLRMALNDVLNAIQLSRNQFECHLQGLYRLVIRLFCF